MAGPIPAAPLLASAQAADRQEAGRGAARANPADQIGRIHAHIDGQFDGYLSELRRYLRQPGISQTGEGIRESARLTLDYVRGLRDTEARFDLFNRAPLQLPIIVFGAAHGARWHEANEYITVEGFREFMKFTVSWLHAWAEESD